MKLEIDYDFLKSFFKDQKVKNIQKKVEEILNSNINFNKIGWVNNVSNILNITPQKVNTWMKKNMYDFWLDKCFKRKGTKI